LLAALVNSVFGLIMAWVLVRYPFPGKRIVDALVDLPFALPTAVAGISLTAIYAQNGWIGRWLPFKVSFTPIGVWVALVFIGLPFVVRTVQPVIEDLNHELEEAAATLGADRWQTFSRVVFPILTPALLTGFAMAFARAIGEYGSVIFIAGNIPMVSEITPLLIITKLEQYDIAGATAIAVVMLVTSFFLLLLINLLQAWSRRRQGGL
jgi:sulfate transport system permease protein